MSDADVRSPAQPRRHGRASRRDPLLIATVTVALLFVIFSVGSPLYGARAFHATELLRVGAPWRAEVANDAPVGNICVGDTVDSVVPQRSIGVKALKSGKLATLDTYDSGGSDLAPGELAGLFNPVTLAPNLVLPASLAPGFAKLLELLVAVGGMALFLRRLGASTSAGVLAGVVYAFSGFMVVWTNWPQTGVAAFVPLLFWAIERVVQRRSLGAALTLTLPVTCMLVGGFPAVTGWAFYAGTGYLLLRLGTGYRSLAVFGRGLATAAGGLVLGLGLAAFTLIPFARSVSQQNFGYRDLSRLGFLPRVGLNSLLYPTAFGTCRLPTTAVGVTPTEANVSVGSVALLLVIVALTGRLRPGIPAWIRPFFVFSLAVALHQIYFSDKVSRGISHLPVFSNNAPGRLHFYVGFGAAVLAGLGADRVLARSWRAQWWRRPQTLALAALWVAAGIGAYASANHSYHVIHGTKVVAHEIEIFVVPLVLAVVAGLAITAAAITHRGQRLVVVGLVALVGWQGYGFARAYWVVEPRTAYYPVTATHQYLDANLGSSRAVGSDTSLRAGTGAIYNEAEPIGHVGPDLGWADLLRQVDPNSLESATRQQLADVPGVLTSPILDLMAVRYFVAEPTGAIPGPTTVIGSAADSAGVALTDGTTVSMSIGTASPRAIALDLTKPLLGESDPYAALDVTVVDSAGNSVSTGSRRVYDGFAVGAVNIPTTSIAAGDSGPFTARITLHDSGQTAHVRGAAGAPQLTVTEQTHDGLRIVRADDTVVFERTNALARVRWAGTVQLVTPAQQAAVLSEGINSNTVVLASGAATSGASATLSHVSVKDTTVSSTVDAAGSGHLVIANAPLPGWRATVDGVSTPIVTADHGMQAIAVPAGHHVVKLHYVQRGQQAGIDLTLLTLLIMLVLLAIVLGRRRQGRRRETEAAAKPASGTIADE